MDFTYLIALQISIILMLIAYDKSCYKNIYNALMKNVQANNFNSYLYIYTFNSFIIVNIH